MWRQELSFIHVILNKCDVRHVIAKSSRYLVEWDVEASLLHTCTRLSHCLFVCLLDCCGRTQVPTETIPLLSLAAIFYSFHNNNNNNSNPSILCQRLHIPPTPLHHVVRLLCPRQVFATTIHLHVEQDQSHQQQRCWVGWMETRHGHFLGLDLLLLVDGRGGGGGGAGRVLSGAAAAGGEIFMV